MEKRGAKGTRLVRPEPMPEQADMTSSSADHKDEDEAASIRNAVAEEQKKWSTRVADLEAEVQRLKDELAAASASSAVTAASPNENVNQTTAADTCTDGTSPSTAISPDLVSDLTPGQITRYSRQLLLADGFGVVGQRKLLSSSVLVVGAGGIGSTVLPYLAASGVGSITVVDFDTVDRSNLHRQVIHDDSSVGVNKAVSACRALTALNPTVSCTAVTEPLTSNNALRLVSDHDLVIDACDNPKTRYLINDACVLAGRRLVSGSAMGTEGQLTVYGCGVDGRPCYRCLYPRVNPTEGCKSCSDNGVLGTVPGLIGILQATEALKLLTDTGKPMYDRLLMYDALQCSFLTIKKPPANRACPVCGPNATVKSMDDSALDSVGARGPAVVDPSPGIGLTAASNGLVMNLPDELQVSCKAYEHVRREGTPHVLLDVRVPRQYEMCSLDGAVNIPLGDIEGSLDRIEDLSNGTKPIYCLCRRGIASAEATRILSEIASKGDRSGIHSVRNITGGLNVWAHEIDPTFPSY